MLKIRFIVVGRTKEIFIREGESFYLRRLRRFVQAEWKEVKPARMVKGRPPEEIMSEEAQKIMTAFSSGDYLVALDRMGKQCDSETMARWLEGLSTSRSGGYVCFIIGGPVGLAKTIRQRADHILSLSRLTLTHEMSRLLLLEQVYRSLTIIQGHQYHK